MLYGVLGAHCSKKMTDRPLRVLKGKAKRGISADLPPISIPAIAFLPGLSAIENGLGPISEYELQSLTNCNNSRCHISSIKGSSCRRAHRPSFQLYNLPAYKAMKSDRAITPLSSLIFLLE